MEVGVTLAFHGWRLPNLWLECSALPWVADYIPSQSCVDTLLEPPSVIAIGQLSMSPAQKGEMATWTPYCCTGAWTVAYASAYLGFAIGYSVTILILTAEVSPRMPGSIYRHGL